MLIAQAVAFPPLDNLQTHRLIPLLSKHSRPAIAFPAPHLAPKRGNNNMIYLFVTYPPSPRSFPTAQVIHSISTIKD
jgi:hypothetical protein